MNKWNKKRGKPSGPAFWNTESYIASMNEDGRLWMTLGAPFIVLNKADVTERVAETIKLTAATRVLSQGKRITTDTPVQELDRWFETYVVTLGQAATPPIFGTSSLARSYAYLASTKPISRGDIATVPTADGDDDETAVEALRQMLVEYRWRVVLASIRQIVVKVLSRDLDVIVPEFLRKWSFVSNNRKHPTTMWAAFRDFLRGRVGRGFPTVPTTQSVADDFFSRLKPGASKEEILRLFAHVVRGMRGVAESQLADDRLLKRCEMVMAARNESASRRTIIRAFAKDFVIANREAKVALATKLSLHEHEILFPDTFEALAKQGECMYWTQDPEERKYADLGMRKEPFDSLINPDAEPLVLGDDEYLTASERAADEAERERCRARAKDPEFISAVRINTNLLVTAYQGLVNRHLPSGSRQNARNGTGTKTKRTTRATPTTTEAKPIEPPHKKGKKPAKPNPRPGVDNRPAWQKKLQGATTTGASKPSWLDQHPRSQNFQGVDQAETSKPAKDQFCQNCKKKGHHVSVCRSRIHERRFQ